MNIHTTALAVAVIIAVIISLHFAYKKIPSSLRYYIEQTTLIGMMGVCGVAICYMAAYVVLDILSK